MAKLPRWLAHPFGLLAAGWFLGVISVGIAGAALAPTALDIVLNAVQVQTLNDDRMWFRYDIDIFSQRQCWNVMNNELTTDRVKSDWTPLGDFMARTRAKFGLTPLTDIQKHLCFDTMPATLSPDNTTIAVGGTLITKDGKWTFGTATASGGNAILLNGSQAAGGFGATLLLLGGEIYTFTADAKWYHWLGMGWSQMASAPVAPTPPPPPAPTYKVSVSGTATTRPLYDGALWAASATWKQIGTVAIGAACEPEVIRKTTVEYHYTTNASKLRGLAACVQGA